MTDLLVPRAALLLLGALLAAPAGAQVVYKLIDRQGRVTFTDSAPKQFDGTVIRLEPDVAANVVPGARPAEAAAKAGGTKDGAPGATESRRRNREELEKKLRGAQARVEAARKALATGADPLPEEMQTIQHRSKPPPKGEPLPRRNCFVTTSAAGTSTLHCPSQVPGEPYYERQKKLETELAQAEEALALAEREYRRGTD